VETQLCKGSMYENYKHLIITTLGEYCYIDLQMI
jgi:hypothetical protein